MYLLGEVWFILVDLAVSCRESYKLLSNPKRVLLADLQASIGSGLHIEQHLESLDHFHVSISKKGLCNGVVTWFEVCISSC